VVYLSACLALLLGGGGVVLWLNTSLAAGAFEIHKLEAELKNHETLQETTIESLVDLAEPAALAEQAAALGMEKSLATGYVILSEGSVILLPSSAEVGAEGAAGAQDGAGEEGAG
jgi:hypothetical protein